MRQLPLLTFLFVLILVSLACGGGATLPATPEPAIVAPASPAPETSSTPLESPATKLPAPTLQLAFLPEMIVAYIRDGNLWFWNEQNGPYQMTNSGDLTDVCISDDGQMLAFVRGSEIWTARTDGTGAGLLVTRAVSGGRLKFSPSGLMLAISDKDQIQLIDLATSTISTVLTYPVITSGYEPEVVWTPDSFGFKTIIPAATGTGQAEFFFVFTSGTVASLAKFVMVPPDESAPLLSPDGGYVIYVSEITSDKKSLHLMDSSGAARPYGEPVTSVRAYGWFPDSQHFVYISETLQGATSTFVGFVNGQPSEISLNEYDSLRWVDAEHFLALQTGNLILGSIVDGFTLIDSGVVEFDFSQ